MTESETHHRTLNWTSYARQVSVSTVGVEFTLSSLGRTPVPDMFGSYDELSKKMTEGKDYLVITAQGDGSSNVAIIAPHGGKIEHGTSEIAKETAGDSYRLYSFEGIMPKDNFTHLHITSHKFAESRCLDLIAGCDLVLAVHGRQDRNDPETTGVSGLNSNLIDAVVRHLRSVGFVASVDSAFPAKNPLNICNCGRSRQGVQIEIPNSLRFRLEDSTLRKRYTGALREGIIELLKN